VIDLGARVGKRWEKEDEAVAERFYRGGDVLEEVGFREDGGIRRTGAGAVLERGSWPEVGDDTRAPRVSVER
jgi:hypothetical protein